MESFEMEFLPKLNKRDLRSIQKAFKEKKMRLENENADFQSLSVEDKECLLSSIHRNMYLTKRLAKKKFTPKKYRYWEGETCKLK